MFKNVYSCCLFLLFLFILLTLPACDQKPKEPIKLGFIGILSGHNAVIGENCRDAALLAIEQINQAGGINGRQVKLIIKDIRNDAVVGQQAVNDLLQEDVTIIIGPMFSSMAVTLSAFVEGKDALIISPTAGSTLLSKKEDNFLRLYPGNDATTKNLAEHLNAKTIRTVGIIRDESNAQFTKNWADLFTENYEKLGGKIVYSGTYLSERDSALDTIAMLGKSNPEAILLITEPVETALLCQQIYKLGLKGKIFTTEWSVSEELISGGGRSVEGLEFFHAINISSQKQKYLDFKKAYAKRFNIEPIFPAVLTYDALHVVFAGLKLGADNGTELKEILLKQKSIAQLQTEIRFDRYGDIERKLFLTTIRDGEFLTLDE